MSGEKADIYGLETLNPKLNPKTKLEWAAFIHAVIGMPPFNRNLQLSTLYSQNCPTRGFQEIYLQDVSGFRV